MEVKKTKLDGVLLITPPTIFKDNRGDYVELYNEKLYKQFGITIDFVQDDISVSPCGVLRGIHGDKNTWKLISCLWGEFYLVVVNFDSSSPQYKMWDSFVLSAANRKQVLVPASFGNGHLVLSESAILHYKQSTYYDRSGQFTIKWNDPEFNISWPLKKVITSQRDKGVENA